MVRGVVREAWVPPDVVEQDRTFLEERAEDAVGSWQLTDGRRHPLADARGDEPREAAATVGHPDRPISSRSLTPCCADDPLEHGVEVGRVAEGQQVEHTGGHRVSVAASTHWTLPVVSAVRPLACSCAPRGE